MDGPEIGPPVFRLSADALHGVTGEGEGRPGVGLQQPGAGFDRRLQQDGGRGRAPCVAASFAGGPR